MKLIDQLESVLSPVELKLAEDALVRLLEPWEVETRFRPASGTFHSVTGLNRPEARVLMSNWHQLPANHPEACCVLFIALDFLKSAVEAGEPPEIDSVELAPQTFRLLSDLFAGRQKKMK